MRLIITTPMALVLDESGVEHIRAEDETGAFGIKPGHADFITVLPVSVITFRTQAKAEHFVVIRGGVLAARNGELVEVAARQAIAEKSLGQLDKAVLERFKTKAEEALESRTSTARLHMAAMRQIQRYLDAGRRSGPQGQPDISGGRAFADTIPGNEAGQ